MTIISHHHLTVFIRYSKPTELHVTLFVLTHNCMRLDRNNTSSTTVTETVVSEITEDTFK